MHTLKDFGVTKHVASLDCGVKVILFYRPNTPISTNILFLAGSRNDPSGKEGLAHFTEHMIFKKTKKFLSQVEVFKFLEKIGGFPNAFTWIDVLGIDITVAKKEDYKYVGVFLDEILNNQIFGREDVEKEKNVILDERRRYVSNPATYIQMLSDEVFLQDTNLAKSTIGSIKSIKSISWENIRNTVEDALDYEDSTVLVSGDIKIEDLISVLNKIFPKKKGKLTPNTLDPLPVNRNKPIMIKKFNDSSQVYVKYGFRTCPYLDKDTSALWLLESILAQGVSSSLFTKLRVENSLVYGVKVDMWGTRDAGVWNVDTATSKENIQELLDLISKEFRRVYEGKLTNEEISLAKSKIFKTQVIKMQSSQNWVSFHMLGALFNQDKATDLTDHLNIIEKITLEDLKRVGKKYFKPGSWYLALCGDIEEKDFRVNY